MLLSCRKMTHSPRIAFATLLAVAFAVLAGDMSAQPPGANVEQVRWLAGCWELSSPQRTVEEHWLAPRGATMLGTGRTVRDGKTIEHEFVVLREQDGKLAYEAHPSGQKPAVFLSSTIAADSVVFENPEHDFPQRVAYERRGADQLLAWVEGPRGGQVRRIEYPYRRVACS
jgi:hypothetical protein